MSNNFDVIVIGAGALGSAAAYHLAKSGQSVLLLEQFKIDHQHGSSYGHSRIIRYAYDYPEYIALAQANYPLWFAFEDEAGEKLYTKTGGIDIAPRDHPIIERVTTCLTDASIGFEELSGTETRERFPQFRLNDDSRAIYQADTGILEASKAVLAQVRMAQHHGATVQAEDPVERIMISGSSVEVRTVNHLFSAARLVVAAGGWSDTLLQRQGINLPLTIRKTQENYFQADSPEQYTPDRFPVFIAWFDDYPFAPYGLPSINNTGVKVGLHGGDDFMHPVEITYTPDDKITTESRRFMENHLPGANGELLHARTCLYTMTPDEHFVIDKHPEHRHVCFAAGGSGHAFKFAQVIGSILRDLALDGETDHDISLFRHDRFD